MKIIWSPTAVRNLDAIWEYIAQDNPDAGDRIVERLKLAASVLADTTFKVTGTVCGLLATVPAVAAMVTVPL